MFDSAPGVHDQVFQLYISMLEGLIVDRWSADEYLRENEPQTVSVLIFVLDFFRFVLIAGCAFEIFDPLSNTGPDFRQFAGTENYHDYHQNYNEFRHSKSKHNDPLKVPEIS